MAQEHEFNTFWDKAQRLDRRWIFLAIVISVVVPMFFDIRLPEPATPEVEAIFDRIESLPEGSNILVAFDFDPPSRPELRPMALSYMRHLAIRGHRIYTMALWPMGQSEVRSVVEELYGPPGGATAAQEGEETSEEEVDEGEVAAGETPEESAEEPAEFEFPDFEYGVDYVMLGFKAGNQGVIQVVLNDFRGMYTSDYAGTPIDDLPIMQDVTNLRDMDLILNISAGYPGLKEWIQFGGDPSGVPIAGGVTAVSAPLLYPYYPGQMFGIMGGIKAAAEYESLLMTVYPDRYPDAALFDGIGRMGPQTFAHITIILLILLGNIAFFATLRGRSKERLKALQS